MTTAALSSECIWAGMARGQLFYCFFNRFVPYRGFDVQIYVHM